MGFEDPDQFNYARIPDDETPGGTNVGQSGRWVFAATNRRGMKLTLTFILYSALQIHYCNIVTVSSQVSVMSVIFYSVVRQTAHRHLHSSELSTMTSSQLVLLNTAPGYYFDGRLSVHGNVGLNRPGCNMLPSSTQPCIPPG